MKKKDKYKQLQNKWKKQRKERGYSDQDTWNFCFWFEDMVPEILKRFNRSDSWHYPLDNNLHRSFPENAEAEFKNRQLYVRRDRKLIEKMLFLLNEMNEGKCSMKNPYEKNLLKGMKRFERKYGAVGEKLRTKKENQRKEDEGECRLYIWLDDPKYGSENTDIWKKYERYERKIERYREKCKDEFFDLLKEHFFYMWY